MRDAPSIPLITALQDMGAKVRVFDPAGMEQARAHLSGVVYTEDPYTCAENADALVIVTEWEQFRALDFKKLNGVMATSMVVDLRNIYKADEVTKTALPTSVSGSPITEKVMVVSIVPFPNEWGFEDFWEPSDLETASRGLDTRD